MHRIGILIGTSLLVGACGGGERLSSSSQNSEVADASEPLQAPLEPEEQQAQVYFDVEEYPPWTPTEEQPQLDGDGTIPRVPNPPLASDLNALPGDLRTIAVPGPGAALDEFVKNRDLALVLGKALFWDMQVGADSRTACATCHFRAGADPRSRNQLSPGLTAWPTADHTFKSGFGPNYQLTAADFPLSRLATPGTRGALDPATDTNDVVSSQGVHHLASGPDPDGFSVAGVKTRRVEPRNTPSVINAVFNHRQFWDGRAEDIFNGVNHVGTRDPNARVLKATSPTTTPVDHQVALPTSSLASQAVAPLTSTLEMAAPGMTVADVARALRKKHTQDGKKLGIKRPLSMQIVSTTDSVLGAYSRGVNKTGLTFTTYQTLIEQSFKNEFWDSDYMVRVDSAGTRTLIHKTVANDGDPTTDEYTLTEWNFALFFGIAVQMYEATLVADDSPWDRFRRSHPSPTDPALDPWNNTNPQHISRLGLFGAMLFNDRTRGPANIRCSNCHESAELTDVSVRRVVAATNGAVRNRDGNVIDKGFNNIGIRPTADDLGAGASDVFGELSKTRRMFPGAPPASFDGATVTQGFGVDGAFKIPSLRNVALTAPYFHNGDARTLRQVVELYSRGGNVAPVQARAGNNIEPLGVPSLTNDETEAIVEFLRMLTDERVFYRRAPFDHPQLFVPNGHPGSHTSVTDADANGFADDRYYEITAVGATGGAPIPPFLEGAFAP